MSAGTHGRRTASLSRSPCSRAIPDPKPIVIDALHFKEDGDGYLQPGNERHLYLIDVASQHIDPLTSDPAFNDDLPVWSPDGRWIAFTRTHEMGADQDGREDIDVIDARTGSMPRNLARPFAPNTQKLAWSPDGIADRVSARTRAEVQRIHARPSFHGSGSRRCAPCPDGQARSRGDVVRLQRRLGSHHDCRGGRRHHLSRSCRPDERRDHAPSGRGPVGRLRSVLGSRSYGAPRVRRRRIGRSPCTGERTAAQAHRAQPGISRGVAAREPSTTSASRARTGRRSTDSSSNPHRSSRDENIPTLLWIHGGPNGQDEHSLVLDGYQFEPQMFATRGFVVLRVNYRGSSGRGGAFAKAIARRLGPQGS